MPPSGVIKTNAKTALRNRWPQALGIGAILLAVYCLHIVLMQIAVTPIQAIAGETMATFVGIAAIIFMVQFFTMPLMYGALRWFWFTSSEAEVPISEIFCYFGSGKEYLRALSLSFRIFMRIAGVLFVCFLPSLIITAVSSPSIYNILNFPMPYWASSVWALGNVLTFFGVIFSFILMLRYFAAPILMINDNSITPEKALSLSVIISKNSNGKTLGFVCSFAGWYLLSLLYIPLLYTIPYFLCSYAVYCRFLINHYNRSITPNENNSFTGYTF